MRKGEGRRVPTVSASVAAVLVFLLLTPLALHAATTRNWADGTGWWDIAGNWSPSGQPQADDNVYITQSGTTPWDVSYHSTSNPSLSVMEINATGSGTITFHQGQDTLTAWKEDIGYSGSGTFTHSAGTNIVGAGGLFVGDSSGSTGTYTLSSSGTLSSSYELMGVLGTGTFTQTGGSNTAAGVLDLGTYAGGVGAYSLSAGSLSASGDLIGDSGKGTFTQTGGSNSITGTTYGLSVGHSSGSTGTYNLSGTGSLSAGEESIGRSGSGTFNHSGGTNTMTGDLFVGRNSGSSGTYNLSDAGVLQFTSNYADEFVGYSGTGTFTQTGGQNTTRSLYIGANSGSQGIFTQSGGTNTITSGLDVGAAPGSNGRYALSGAGVLSAVTEIIGDAGTGTFTQTGGTNTVGGGLYVGYADSGTFNQSGGTNTISGELTIGYGSSGWAGNGTYNLSDNGNPLLSALSAGSEAIGDGGAGTFNQGGGTNTTGTLTVKAQPTGSGTYNLSGGTLNATSVVNNDHFNYSGGTLNNSYTGQTFTNNAGATFTLSGPGTRTVNASVTNNSGGTVQVTGLTYGTRAVFAGAFTNYGVLTSDPATLEFLDNLVVGPGGTILASSGDQYILHKSLLVDSSVNTGGWSTNGANLTFTGPGPNLLSFGNSTLAWNSLSVDGGGAVSFGGPGTLSASTQTIGDTGSGTFTHSAGTNTMTGDLFLGRNSGGTGTYALSATGALSARDEDIGYYGAGTVTQTGGTNDMGGLWVGVCSGGTGTYNLSGTGAVSTSGEAIGSYGTGTFNQTGGTNTIMSGGLLTVGYRSGSTGTYNLSGTGLLSSSGGESIGVLGTGTFNQTGGTNAISGDLALGYAWASYAGNGTYNLSDTGNPLLSVLSARSEIIGDGGTGTFTQTGGTNTTGTLTITGSGTYNLSGGTLNATSIVNNDHFNYSAGTLNQSFSGQTFTNNAGATFAISGSGTRTVNAEVTNYGTVKVAGMTDGTTVEFKGAFTNYGTLNSDPATLEFFDDLIIGAGGSILASAGDQYILHQDFLINTSTAGWTTAGADLTFTGAGTHEFSFSGSDLTWNELSLENGAILDFSGAVAFNVGVLSGLSVSNGIVTNIMGSNGFTLYYDPLENPTLSGVYQLTGGGTLDPIGGPAVPLPTAVWLGLLGLAVAARRLKRSGDLLPGRTQE